MMRFDRSSDFFRLVLPLVAICLVGCGGGDSDEPSATDNDEIAAFIEENPEYGDSARPPSDSTGLGLER